MEKNKTFTGLEIPDKRISEYCNERNIDFTELNQKEKAYMLEATNYYKLMEASVEKDVKNISIHRPTIDGFCRNIGVSRAAIYKKEANGSYKYPHLVEYLKTLSSQSKSRANARLKILITESSNQDSTILNALLKKEAIYQIQKQELHEKELQIKSLLKEIEYLKKKVNSTMS